LLVAACAAQQDNHYPENEAINKRMKFSDNYVLWEDNSVYMNRDQSSLDRITKAQKRRKEEAEEKGKETQGEEGRTEILRFHGRRQILEPGANDALLDP